MIYILRYLLRKTFSLLQNECGQWKRLAGCISASQSHLCQRNGRVSREESQWWDHSTGQSLFGKGSKFHGQIKKKERITTVLQTPTLENVSLNDAQRLRAPQPGTGNGRVRSSSEQRSQSSDEILWVWFSMASSHFVAMWKPRKCEIV